jgi:hypothetical protein
MPARRRTITILIWTALVAGCSSGGAGSVGSTPPPEATAADVVTLPIDPYRFTTWETGRIILAREILITDCLRKLDDKQAVSPDRASIERDTLKRIKDFGPRSNKRRYGVVDQRDAATYGYHLPSSTNKADQGVPLRQNDSVRTECVQQVDNTLGDANLTSADLVRTIGHDSYDRSLASSEIRDAFQRWSSCMGTKGYRYPDPMAAMSTFDLVSPTVSKVEIATATADVACKLDGKLVMTWQEVESKIQRSAIDEHRHELQQIAERNEQFRDRIAETISTDG